MANLSKEGNIQHKLGFAGLLITLGIVFGDIGTSPLYVMKAIIHTGCIFRRIPVQHFR